MACYVPLLFKLGIVLNPAALAPSAGELSVRSYTPSLSALPWDNDARVLKVITGQTLW